MITDIERLLRLTADFQNFCDGPRTASAGSDEELTEEELDLVAAAGTYPVHEPESPFIGGLPGRK